MKDIVAFLNEPLPVAGQTRGILKCNQKKLSLDRGGMGKLCWTDKGRISKAILEQKHLFYL